MHVSDWYRTIISGIAGLSSHDPPGRPPLDGFDQWPTLARGARAAGGAVIQTPLTVIIAVMSDSLHKIYCKQRPNNSTAHG
jgi:hypothetical protein